jgi:polysaccharide deacetylase family protein (PEP-CTERM system associated)
MTMDSVINAMTVDVEDYFQVSAFEKYIQKDSWDNLELRVEANVERLITIFENSGISATFFMLGWIAERCPGMIHRIVDAGHELASHGYSHVRIGQQQKHELREDIIKTKTILEDISGIPIIGYRAASFSISSIDHWAYDVLEEAGFKYSSSIYPVRHDIYGVPDAPRFPYKPENGNLLEIPMTTMEFCGIRIPCAGGGYFRLFPYQLSRWLIRRINSKEIMPCIFYFHPWELDVDQPRLNNLDLKTRFRHYNNIDNMEKRLLQLFRDFKWGRMDNIFLSAK